MKRVIILGAGHSLTSGIEKGLWDKIKTEETWSCNSIFKIMPYLPSKEFWVDMDFFDKMIDDLTILHKQGVELVAKRFTNRKKWMHLQNNEYFTQYDTTRENDKYFGKKALEHNLIYYGMTGLCGTFALSVAIARGYDEIFILGCDFGNNSLSEPQTHVYSREQLEKLGIYCTGAFRPSVYRLPDDTVRREIIDYDVFVKEDVKIWNVSLTSNIYQFPRISYETFFEMLK